MVPAIRPYAAADEAQVVELWRACGLLRPWNDPHRDIARKLRMQPALFGVMEEAGALIGSVMAGYEGHRGWVNYLAVAPAVQRRGLGRQLMSWAESRLAGLGCPKINLQVRSENGPVLAFYAALGYAPDDVRSLGKRLVHDDAPAPDGKHAAADRAAAAQQPAAAVIGIDHIFIAASDLARSAAFYDRVLVDALGFRKRPFAIAGEPHVHYFNRHFGYVLRPARLSSRHEPYAPGLHHFCLRVESAADVQAVAVRLQSLGIAATPAQPYTEYADDYVATFFEDPDGLRLEVTNFRQERRERHDCWEHLPHD